MKQSYLQKIITKQQLIHPEKYIGKIEQICFRSSWEISFARWLDTNDSVLEWRSEEDVIMYTSPVDGRKHRYFMDFYFKYKKENNEIWETLVEIKPYNQTQKPELKEQWTRKRKEQIASTYIINQAKWSATRQYVESQRQQGRKLMFKIVTEKDVIFGIKE
jgi:hypothetical protein